MQLKHSSDRKTRPKCEHHHGRLDRSGNSLAAYVLDAGAMNEAASGRWRAASQAALGHAVGRPSRPEPSLLEPQLHPLVTGRTQVSGRAVGTPWDPVWETRPAIGDERARAHRCRRHRLAVAAPHYLDSAASQGGSAHDAPRCRSHLALDDADPDFGVQYSVETLRRHGGSGVADIPSALHGAPETAEVPP